MYKEWKEDTVKSSWSSHGIHRRTKKVDVRSKTFLVLLLHVYIYIFNMRTVCLFSNSSFDNFIFFLLQVSRWILSYFCAHRIILLLLSLCHAIWPSPLPFWFLHFFSSSLFSSCFFLVYEKISLYIYWVFV